MGNQSVAFGAIHLNDFVYNVLKYKHLILIYIYHIYYPGDISDLSFSLHINKWKFLIRCLEISMLLIKGRN
jgi:hypothetical protein